MTRRTAPLKPPTTVASFDLAMLERTREMRTDPPEEPDYDADADAEILSRIEVQDLRGGFYG